MADKGSAAKPKVASRVALVNVNEEAAKILGECFRQFNVDPMFVNGLASSRLWKEKFEGVVVPLIPGCEAVLKGARTSPSNKHSLLYGITPDTKTAIQYSEYGLNALFFEPLEKSAALRVVRATNLLLLHEYRRYVRIPVAVEALLETQNDRISALTVDVSSGGLSIASTNLLWDKRDLRATVQLPGAKKVTVRSHICWRRENDQTLGINFEPDEPGRAVVREWIDGFLQFV